MDIKIRNCIKKIKPLYQFIQKLLIIECKNYYRKLNKNSNNRSRINSLKNSHNGESCFIVGNGPSLSMEDLNSIMEYDSFAANLIFKIFDKTKWRPKYYFILDRYADTGSVLDDIDLEYLFVGDYYWKYRGMKNSNAICIHTERCLNENKVGFSSNAEKVLYSHFTVTHAMIQMAVYMGYKRIYLLGMDHSYSLTYDKNGNVIKNDKISSHVFEDKNPNDVIANVEGMNKAYISCKKYADENGISIVNVTRGGNLEWFERKKLEDVLMEETNHE